MSAELGKAPEPVGWVGTRNFIVPPDIVPVRRTSPIPQKKRTVCRPRAEGEAVCRSGEREWFGDRVFVDTTTTRDVRTACGTSITAHASCVIGLIVLMAGQPQPSAPVRVSTPLRMPAFVAMAGGGSSGGGAPQLLRAPAPRTVTPDKPRRVAKSEPPKVTPTPTAAPPAIAEPVVDLEPEPEVEPAAATAEAPAETAANAGGAAGGTGDGNGGGNGNTGGIGTGTGTGVGAGAGPYRLGRGIEPPRKIKDVPPRYPADAMAARTFGTVALEAVIGANGRIQDVKVVRSIPLLDQAAIDCVRQWEFAPATMSGTPVPVIVTILVGFSIR
jgi:protein TonB